MLHTVMVADVGRKGSTTVMFVVHGHAQTAAAADGEALQQGGAFPGRTAVLHAQCPGIIAEAPLVFLEFVPGDVAWMDILYQSDPFFPG